MTPDLTPELGRLLIYIGNVAQAIRYNSANTDERIFDPHFPALDPNRDLRQGAEQRDLTAQQGGRPANVSKKDAHMLVFGPTGAGKSAIPTIEPLWFDPLTNHRDNAHLLVYSDSGDSTKTLIHMLLQAMAIHRPRLIIVEVEPCYDMMAEYFKIQGMTVNMTDFSSVLDVSNEWPDADVTVVNMQEMLKLHNVERNDDTKALGYCKLLDKVQMYAERFKSEGRPMIFLTDDANKLLPYVATGDVNDKVAHSINNFCNSGPDLNTWLWLGATSFVYFPDPVLAALLGDNTIENKILLGIIDDKKTEFVLRGNEPNLSKFRQKVLSGLKGFPKHNNYDMLINASGLSLFCRKIPNLPCVLSEISPVNYHWERKIILKYSGCTELQADLIMEELYLAHAKAS
jgi:hypothetical protein